MGIEEKTVTKMLGIYFDVDGAISTVRLQTATQITRDGALIATSTGDVSALPPSDPAVLAAIGEASNAALLTIEAQGLKIQGLKSENEAIAQELGAALRQVGTLEKVIKDGKQ
jgi:hypothetical protein